MATLQKRIEDLAKQVALDQITQDIENEQKFVKKDDIGTDETVNRLLALEEKVSRLIAVVWVQEKVEPLSLRCASFEVLTDLFSVRCAFDKSIIEVRKSERC